jgi:hypothetical protein
METNESPRFARREYTETVVLYSVFWCQSMKTLPARSARAMREMIRVGRSRSSSSAARRASGWVTA